MNASVSIRRANERDAEELVRLNRAFNEVEMAVEKVRESLTQSSEIVAVALIDGQPVGFACAQYQRSFCYPVAHGEITELYVQIDARRKGLATSLIRFLENELRSRGISSVRVITGTQNATAIQVYEKSNYVRQDHLVLSKVLQ